MFHELPLKTTTKNRYFNQSMYLRNPTILNSEIHNKEITTGY